jgi:hypothetical protein
MPDDNHYESKLFSYLHDEQQPVGRLGRGTHYSVIRCTTWQDEMLRRRAAPVLHDLAIIWDEDHDRRVIEAIELIYMAGLLGPVLFIGERKGGLTVLTKGAFTWGGPDYAYQKFCDGIAEIAESLDDPWPSSFGTFDPKEEVNPWGLISSEPHQVDTYLRNINNLWDLGHKEFAPGKTQPQYPWARPEPLSTTLPF